MDTRNSDLLMWIRESSDKRWEKNIYHWPGLENNNGLWWLWLRGTMSFLALMEEMVSEKTDEKLYGDFTCVLIE